MTTFTPLNEPTEVVVSRLFRSRINMHMQPLQTQVGGSDCGLFAIAVITAIAHGEDPSQLQFKQEDMRDHLLHCFKDLDELVMHEILRRFIYTNVKWLQTVGAICWNKHNMSIDFF